MENDLKGKVTGDKEVLRKHSQNVPKYYILVCLNFYESRSDVAFFVNQLLSTFCDIYLLAKYSSEHPLSALSNGDISVVSSFNVGDTFSECVIGDSARLVTTCGTHQYLYLSPILFTS